MSTYPSGTSSSGTLSSGTSSSGTPPFGTSSSDTAAYKLAVDGLTVTFGHGRRATTVLHGVSTGVRAGQTLGLVGESGSGKSTIAKAIVGVNPVRSGRITLDGRDLTGLGGRELAAVRRRVQLVSQDPYASLNPRMTIGQAVAEAVDPVRADARRHAATVERWLETVSLDGSAADRYPHEFSGGQRQRVAVARALAVEPEVLIADEITSALDASVQAEVLNLLQELRRSLSLTMVFISHDLAVVRHVSDEVAVLCHGELVEQGRVHDVYRAPQHSYTRRLLASVPTSGAKEEAA
ncbi:ABC transporter ATP-binding protein [Streptomyces sp. KLOTTS4A1]|uniref:ABC transporter ATP-binding protein n=1 Tax=Streptomyces sp. KLOTTS4A1 TaxID=3390996 RepID=UPI0039F497B8